MFGIFNVQPPDQKSLNFYAPDNLIKYIKYLSWCIKTMDYTNNSSIGQYFKTGDYMYRIITKLLKFPNAENAYFRGQLHLWTKIIRLLLGGLTKEEIMNINVVEQALNEKDRFERIMEAAHDFFCQDESETQADIPIPIEEYFDLIRKDNDIMKHVKIILPPLIIHVANLALRAEHQYITEQVSKNKTGGSYPKQASTKRALLIYGGRRLRPHKCVSGRSRRAKPVQHRAQYFP